MISSAKEVHKKGVRRRLIGFSAFGLLCALFALVIANALWATGQRRTAEAIRVHSLDVLLVAGRLESAINQAMRGERGYLLTHDREFLIPYFEGRARSLRLTERLRAMTRDNLRQRRDLAVFTPRLHSYLGTLSRLIALEEKGDHARAVRDIRGGLGRREITSLLGALDLIESEERRLLALRSSASLRADDRIETYYYVVAALGLMIMIMFAIAIRGAARAHLHGLALAEELHRLATTDTLTGLPNRRQLMLALDTEILRANRTGRALTLALLDVDRFKKVNDTHGHPAGDEILRAVADELRQVTRGGDVLGRYGGEEFAILMPETTMAEAERACERLRAAIASRIVRFPDGSSGRVTISTGVALLAGQEDTSHLIARADAALYTAKSDGRNLVRLAA